MAVTDEGTAATGATVKRKRVVTSKPTRNGCKTCRARRIKCDEARPVCVKCTTAGRTCGGYAPLSSSRTATSRPLLPASRSPSAGADDASSATTISVRRSPAFSRSPTPIAPLSVAHFCINDVERNAYDFFRFRMAGPLEIMSPAKGWIQQALQVSLASKSVFHAIAALGGANLAIGSMSHPTMAGPHKPAMYTDALDQYSKTIAALNHQIRAVIQGRAPLQPVLLTCLLLVCFELHAERSSMALRHHAMGRKIMQKSVEDGGSSFSGSSQSSGSLQILSEAFDKLCVSSAYPGSVQTQDFITYSDAQQPNSMPLAPIDRLAEAWNQLDQLIDSGSQLLRKLYLLTERQVKALYRNTLDQATQYCLSSCWSKSIRLPAHDTTLVEIACLLEEHERWQANTTAFYGRDQQTTPALALLQLRQWMAAFALKTCRETRETAIDCHEGDFNRALDLAQIYLQPLNTISRPLRLRTMFGNGQDDDFTLEQGIISALYLISLKSRTSSTRHRAVDILANAYRREGLGSSTITAQIALAIIRVEEIRARDMGPASHPDLLNSDVPEVARFADIVHAAGLDVQRPECRLVCARYLHESGGGIEIIEYLSKGPCFPYSKCAGKCLTGFNFEISKEKVWYDISTAAGLT